MKSRLLFSILLLCVPSCSDGTRPPTAAAMNQLEKHTAASPEYQIHAPTSQPAGWSFFGTANHNGEQGGADSYRRQSYPGNSTTLSATAQKKAAKEAAALAKKQADAEQARLNQQGLADLWQKRNAEMQSIAGTGTIHTFTARSNSQPPPRQPAITPAPANQTSITPQPNPQRTTHTPERTCAYSSYGGQCKRGANSGSRYCAWHGDNCAHPGCTRFAMEGSNTCSWH
jgi:hypothetical protein